MSTPDLKVGDHIRVTDVIEGKVTKIESYGVWMERAEGAGPHVWIDTNTPGWHRTFETVVPPEPEWVNGDVIHVIGEDGKRTPMIFCAEGEFAPPHSPVWTCASCFRGWHLPASVSEDWRNGDVEILYKADAQKVA